MKTTSCGIIALLIVLHASSILSQRFVILQASVKQNELVSADLTPLPQSGGGGDDDDDSEDDIVAWSGKEPQVTLFHVIG